MVPARDCKERSCGRAQRYSSVATRGSLRRVDEASLEHPVSTDTLLTLGQAARLLGCCPGRIYRFVIQGRTPAPDEWSRFKVSELQKLKPLIEDEDRKTKEER